MVEGHNSTIYTSHCGLRPAAYGVIIVGLPLQIAYGGGVEKRHVIALWQRCNGYSRAIMVKAAV